MRQNHFDSSPCQLRSNLNELDRLLGNCDPRLRRRALLVFGELAAQWQQSFSGEPISVDLEFLPGAVRMDIHNEARTLTGKDWERLVTPVVADLVDGWGLDRRRFSSNAWFEFGEGAGRRSATERRLMRGGSSQRERHRDA